MAETYQEEMENEESIEKVKKFMHNGCGCALGAKGGPCSGQFSADVLFTIFIGALTLLTILRQLQILTHY